MKPQQTTQTPQSPHTPTVPDIRSAPLEVTLQEIVQLFGEQNRLLTTLQKTLEAGQNELPVIDIED